MARRWSVPFPGLAAGLFLFADEISEGDVEGVGEEKQVVEVGDAVGAFPADEGFAVAADVFGEGFLGEAGGCAGGADAVPDLPSSGNDPVGHGVAWHPATLE